MTQSFKYQAIYQHMVEAIGSGTLLAGEKLPSLRSVCQTFSCSLSVALQAYRYLEAMGYARAVEKSGYFASHPQKVNLPEPEQEAHTLQAVHVQAMDDVESIMKMGMDPNIVPLNCAIPAASLLPENKLKQSMAEHLRRHSSSLLGYTLPQGNLELRSELARRLFHKGVKVSPDELVITNGCTEALSIAIQSVSHEGDVIAIETPAFFGIVSLLQSLKRKVVEIPITAQRGADLEALEKACQRQEVKAFIFTANFQNPLGFVMPKEQKSQLLELAERYDFCLIEDDVYGECGFDETSTQPAKAMDSQGRVIYCSSFSKSLAPGLRIGWAIPGLHLKRFTSLKYGNSFGEPDFIQGALAAFLRSAGYDRFLRQYRKSLYQQTQSIRAQIIEHFPEGTRVSNPQGGFLLWVELPERHCSQTLFEQALARKIGFIPGSAFSISGHYRNCLRISCATPVNDRVIDAIHKLGKLSNLLI